MNKYDFCDNKKNTKLVRPLTLEMLEAEKRHADARQLRDMNGKPYDSHSLLHEEVIFPWSIVRSLHEDISCEEMGIFRDELSATWVHDKGFFEPLRVMPVPEKLKMVSESLVHWTALVLTYKSFYYVAKHVGAKLKETHTVESVVKALSKSGISEIEVKAALDTMVSLGGLTEENGAYTPSFVDYTMKDIENRDVAVEVDAFEYLRTAVNAIARCCVLKGRYNYCLESECTVKPTSVVLKAFYPFESLHYIF